MTRTALVARCFASLACLALALPAVTGAGVRPDDRNLDPDADQPVRRMEIDGSPAGPGQALDLFDFPSDDSDVVASVGFIDGEQVGYFWSVSRGDSVVETFSGPPSATGYRLDVDVIENALNSGASVLWDVVINGVTVDAFEVVEGFLGTVSREASFAAIAGPSYTVELRVTNEVPGGQGSHTLRYAGAGLHQVELLEQCSLALELPRRLVAPGEELVVGFALDHRRHETVTVPITLWIEDAGGAVVASHTTAPLTIRYGDEIRHEVRIPVPTDLAPGNYRVVVGVREMRQGVAGAWQSFQVGE